MSSFATKYRPRNLEEVIGHESVVTKLRGIIKSKKYPNALLITGPSSAGKTTLARAFAASLSGVDTIEGSTDFYEVNCADTRTIDDMRAIVSSSKLHPMKLPKRFILLDEAQQLLSLNASTQCMDGGVVVLTEKGRMTIKEIHERIQRGEEIRVASFNHQTEEVEFRKVEASRSFKNSKPCLQAGKAVFTHDHRFWDLKAKDYVEARYFSGSGIVIKTMG